ncbi:MAG: hypothetical protein WD877_02870 [Candidatus Saccharimonadales bacterium]
MRVTHRLVTYSAEARRVGYKELKRQRQNQPLPLQIGKAALYMALSRPVINILQNHYGGDYEFIGNGGEQLVFKSDKSQEVLKLIISTAGSTKAEAEQQAEYFQALSDSCQSYLGERWVDTRFRVVSLPFVKKYSVASLQPLIKPERSFLTAEEVTDFADTIGRANELDELVTDIQHMHAGSGVYPDLLGPGNVVLTRGLGFGERLKILDTIPETPDKLLTPLEDAEITRGEAMASKLQFWAEAVRAARQQIEFRQLVLH